MNLADILPSERTREIANAIDQLFCQRHTMKDVERLVQRHSTEIVRAKRAQERREAAWERHLPELLRRQAW